MDIEQTGSNKPSFLMVVLLAAAAILVIIIAAATIVTWRAHKQNKPPYTKHPVSALPRVASSVHAA